MLSWRMCIVEGGLRTGLGFGGGRVQWEDSKQWSMPEEWSGVLREGVKTESRSNRQRSPCRGPRIASGENETMLF